MSREGRYKVISLNQRQEIIEILNTLEEKGVKPNYSAIARQFNVSARTITRIRGSKENWQSKLKEAETLPSFSKRKKLPIINGLEETLYQWFSEKRDAGESVSGSDLREKALIFNQAIQGNSNFKASEGWLTRFKIRYEIGSYGLVEKIPPKPPSDSELCGRFIEKFGTLIKEKCFRLHQMYNIDETSLVWRSTPGNVLEAHFQNEQDFDQAKERVTILTCSNASGTHKVPLFVIGDSKSSQFFRGFHLNQLPVIYVESNKCEMTSDIFRQWYTQVFLPSVRKYQIERHQFYQVLLILDNENYRMTKEEIDSLDGTSSVEFIPSRISSIFQPMKQGIVERMKTLYRRSFLKELLLVGSIEGVLEVIRQGNIKTFSVQLASAWREITATDIRRSWKKILQNIEFGPSSKDEISVMDFIEILHRIPGFHVCTPDDVTEWFQTDNRYFDIAEDPLKIVKEENEENCSHQYEDNDVVPKASTPEEAQEAFMAFKKYRKWLESRGECETDHLIALQKLSELTIDLVSRITIGETCNIIE